MRSAFHSLPADRCSSWPILPFMAIMAAVWLSPTLTFYAGGICITGIGLTPAACKLFCLFSSTVCEVGFSMKLL